MDIGAFERGLSTMVTLSAAPSPSVSGQTATLSVTVKAVPPGKGTPTGTVTFFQKVGQDNTSTAVVSSSHPSVFGQSVTFTVVVSAAAPGAGTPTGTVTFYDGVAPLGTGTLSGGKATLSTKTLAVGSHSITVIYGWDASFLGSTSAVLTQTVNGTGGDSVTAASVAVDAAIGALSPDEWGTALIDDLAGEQVSVGGRRTLGME